MGKEVVFAIRISSLENDIASLYVSKLTKCVCDYLEVGQRVLIRQETNLLNCCWPLGARHERPSCRAAKRDDEFSTPDVNCHLTLPRGHATEGTISHPDVLRCGIATRLMSAGGPPPEVAVYTLMSAPTSSGH